MINKKMKILQVNVVYAKGSTGKIVAGIHRELLNDGFESVVCFGRGQVPSEKFIYKTCGELYSHFNHLLTKFSGVMYGGCFFSTNRLIRIIKKERPDIVHLHCLNGYFVNIYRLLNWLKCNNVNTVLTLHAEFMFTGGCGYALDCENWQKNECRDCQRWKQETESLFLNKPHLMWTKLKDAFNGFDDISIVSVSPWLMERAKRSPILQDKNHFTVLNGLDCSVFRRYETSELRKKYLCDFKKIVLHVTASFSSSGNNIKGGAFVIELAKMNPDLRFIIVGPCDEDILVPGNVLLLGKIQDQKELARLYAMADVTLLTSRKETFSMVIAESLCCGTPVVGFEAGGPESIAIKGYCDFSDYANILRLNELLNKSLNAKWDKAFISNIAHKKYSKIRMTEDYIQIYERCFEKTI